MRALFPIALLFTLATPAAGADWQYEDRGIPIAYVDNGAAQFQFACRGGDLAMAFWVRAPHTTVAEAKSMNLAIIPDPAKSAGKNSTAGASFAQDMPLIHSDGTSMVIRGPVAKQWATIARTAKHTIRVAYIRKHGAIEVFDSNDFGATGSASAIKQVLDRCG
jgi:hypothetical protein